MVIKGADRDKLVTISMIAVLLKVGTAMATEVIGSCVFKVMHRFLNLLSRVTSPNLSSKSAANTLGLIYLPKKGSLDTNLDDVATIVDVSQVHDITDVGRLTSPLFSQEQSVSAIPFLFSDVFKRGETHAGR